MSERALPTEPAERVAALLERGRRRARPRGRGRGRGDRRTRSPRAIEGEDLGLLIGRRGQTIDAVQLLCYRAAFRGRGERKRVSVDAAGYRERRRETVERQAERAAERALADGKEIELEPMTRDRAQDRPRAPQDRPGVETYSEGDEPERCVIVAPLVARLSASARASPEPPARRDRARAAVVELLAADPASLSSVRDRERAWKVHVADSLSGLELERLAAAPDRRPRRRRGLPGPGARRGAARRRGST